MRARWKFAVFLLIAGSPTCAFAQQLVVGSATTVNNFHGLSYHHASLLFPVRDSAGSWRPDAWAAGVGFFRRDGDDAAVYTFGPVWRHDHPFARCRCFLDAGISVAYLEQREFFDSVKLRDEDFGNDLQFMSRVSLGWYLESSRAWSVELNVLHVSNGGLSDINPGADLVGVNLQAEF